MLPLFCISTVVAPLLCSSAFCHSGGAPVDYRWQHFFATEQNGWGILPRGLRQKIASCSPGQCFQTAPVSYHFKFYSANTLKKAHNLILAFHKYYITSLTPVFHTGSLRVVPVGGGELIPWSSACGAWFHKIFSFSFLT